MDRAATTSYRLQSPSPPPGRTPPPCTLACTTPPFNPRVHLAFSTQAHQHRDAEHGASRGNGLEGTPDGPQHHAQGPGVLRDAGSHAAAHICVLRQRREALLGRLPPVRACKSGEKMFTATLQVQDGSGLHTGLCPVSSV